MELHQGRDVYGHGFGTAPMVEWRACKDTRIRIAQSVEVGGTREPSCVHGNVYGKGQGGGCPRTESTHVCSSPSSPACASSTARANVACRWCTAMGCHLPGRGGGFLRLRKQIELVRLTTRERWVAETRTWLESRGVVRWCWGWWRWRRRRRRQSQRGLWDAGLGKGNLERRGNLERSRRTGWWLRRMWSRYKNAFEQTERWGQPVGAALPIQGKW
jgi:hypothetical protein